jgi:glycolate oxidase
MTSSAIPIDRIAGIVGDANLLTAEEDRAVYGYDASRLKAMPEVVVFPGSAGEIAELMKLAHRHRVPVYPRGAGTSMVGAAVPGRGGMVVALSRLNRILEIDPDNMLAVVEPSVINAKLEAEAARQGLYYPPDPASFQFSTIGGNVAMNAGGPRAVKYGVTRDYVMGLEAVTARGELLRTGGRTAKGVVGYDLTRLLVGSEGTLGIFTKLILKLIPAPEASRTLLAVFPELEKAGRAVSDLIRSRVLPSTLELMDQACVRVVEDYLHMGLPVDAEALLLMEVDGRECVLDEDVERIRAICGELGAERVDVADSEAGREALWRARRSVSAALRRIRPDKINEDVTVPRSRVPDLIRTIHAIAERHGLTIANFGHAGDGNVHVNIMLDRSDSGEVRRAEQAVEELFRAVLDLEGTLSGEHGVGITKSPFFQWEVGRTGFDAMLAVKRALDPHNILNPDKMFVPDRAFFRSEP